MYKFTAKLEIFMWIIASNPLILPFLFAPILFGIETLQYSILILVCVFSSLLIFGLIFNLIFGRSDLDVEEIPFDLRKKIDPYVEIARKSAGLSFFPPANSALFEAIFRLAHTLMVCLYQMSLLAEACSFHCCAEIA